MDEELHQIIHELKNLRTVDKVHGILIKEVTERHLKQAQAIANLSKQLDKLLVKSTRNNPHAGDRGCWP
jgi:hypothetical protein